MSNVDHFIWTEKYRPKTIDECVLSISTKNIARGYISEGKIPTMLLSGGAGQGKTTLAKAICNEVGADWIIINCGVEGGIDLIRTKITQFASTVSFTEAKKVTILDEADALTLDAQRALRNFIEEFAGNHSVIMTCNFKSRIIEPLHSRCHVIDFKIPAAERPKLASEFFKKTAEILDKENVAYDKKVVAELVQKFFPDFRRCLNELQKYASAGAIDSGILVDFTEQSFNELVTNVKANKFNEVRKWVANNVDTDASRIFRMFYDKASEKLNPLSIAQLIMILNQYQVQASQVADAEINLVAFFVEIMTAKLDWK